jgi:hypothetical protein
MWYNIIRKREGKPKQTGKEVRTMTELMDLTLYLLENGYDGDLTDLTLEEVRAIAVEFFGEDPTA